ncbi:hypothetical protein Q8791_29090 [Nocardiopsis sp. CT-R113]|uniref:Uncharacterized protein n=1 Tax=Nocardiopsis codii TaxID=3065942 RepID=A0ABU7KGE4_9ACTN|nr:hypothetical protein [Nocardiopsis sp. CT-R113]MEE2041288.1 hypothetical protein [Nocardiopsis sp. CT-R113]
MPRPAYPPDWSSTVRGLQNGVKAAYTAAQTRVRYSAIRAASILIGAAGALGVAGATEAQRILYVGRDEGGTGSRLWLGRPKDGSAVLDLRAAEGEAGQWALRDQHGNAVVAEGPDGLGLARPVMPVATSWINDFPGGWPSTTSTSWTPLAHAWAVFQHTTVTFYFKASALSVSGQIRFLVDGDVIATRSIPTGTPAPIRTERFTVQAAQYYNPTGPLRVELQGRCTGTGGGIHATHFYNEGAGAVPTTEPPP